MADSNLAWARRGPSCARTGQGSGASPAAVPKPASVRTSNEPFFPTHQTGGETFRPYIKDTVLRHEHDEEFGEEGEYLDEEEEADEDWK